jgi:hypothetical protein
VIVRSLATLIFACSLVLVPSLCAAGMLGHGCPEDDQAACEHESECSADPCSGLVARLPDEGRGPDAAAPDGGPAAPPAVPARRAARLAPRPSAPPAPPRALPCPASDLPLLS